jgi:hypothetical protein
MRSQESQRSKSPVRIRGANDNTSPHSGIVTDTGAPLPSPSITPAELALLQPLIKALARMAANDLSATTLSSES